MGELVMHGAARRAARDATALERLRTMARQRPILAGGLRAALARHEAGPQDALEAWAAAVLALANVNAGPGALLSAFRIAASLPRHDALGSLSRATAGLAATATICRRAGAGAARAALDARYDLGGRLARSPEGDEAVWWRTLAALAREEPAGVLMAARITGRVVAACGTEGFEAFVGAALKSARETAARLAFLSLEDATARRVLDRLSGQLTFEQVRGQMQAYATALWAETIALREMPPSPADTPRRATLSPGVVHVPDVLPGVAREAARNLYRAIVAHATAHLALGGPRREPGSLKPLQITLVGLIEDARIEALAMRRFPGLFRQWAPYHTVRPSHLKTAPLILARLARGLFDPAYADDDAIVAKARAMFRAERDLEDAGLSRRIGSVLGNDIGQMRIQFDAKSFVVEPAYRDDNFGLWLLPPPPQGADHEALDLHVESARVERMPDEDGRGASDDAEAHGRGRPVASSDEGVAVAHYPEWDRAAGVERPDWTTVREIDPPRASSRRLEEALEADAALRRRVDRLVRAARIGRPTRLKRQPDGAELDLDAVVDAARALRAGEIPDARIHMRKMVRVRDLATLILVDISESTRDRVPALNARIIDVERVALALLAKAMDAAHDSFALRAFASDGRGKIRWLRLKDFDERFDTNAMGRLAGLEPGFSTRLGAALRHAGAEIAPIAATRKAIIVLGDGAPFDIDVPDPTDLVADARRAVLGLRVGGIDTFGLMLDASGHDAGAAIFGQAHHMPVRRIEDLPARLSALYFRIARR